ncbi:MAG: T9SS type A sorting domain-containing protein [Bacteroidia bacterium]|nr:T9SS type A sorting domain-containing protein [Bacteroidia bacterium]
MRLFLLTLVILSFFNFKLKACHGLALVNVSYTISSTGITISGASDPATCGCGPYWMQAIVSTDTLYPVAPSTLVQSYISSGAGGAVVYNSFPWYHSLLNVPNYTSASVWPDECTVEPYHDVFIPFSDLTCGGVYYFSVREWLGGSAGMPPAGPWTAPVSFTVPGNPGQDLSFSLNTVQDTICSYDTISISAVNIVNGPITNYNWSDGAGTTSTVNVSPNITTSYILTASNGGGCVFADTLTIHVLPILNPNFIPSNPIICTGDNIIFSAVGSPSLSSHYWSFNPNSGFTVNNSTVTPTPDVNFNSAGNYAVTHTISSMGCSYTATTNVIVNVCTSIKEESDEAIAFFPNPSSGGIFNITYPKHFEGNIDVEVYDLMGKTVFVKQNISDHKIQLNELLGVYFVKITSNKQMLYFIKIVIE